MLEFKTLAITDSDLLPATNGIYIFKTPTEILYVGKSVNIRARVHSHIENAKNSVKEAKIIDNSTQIEYGITDSEFTALLLESSLIQKFHPKYNVQWRDDKSYLYIKITTYEEYPKIFLVRKPHTVMLRHKDHGKNGSYFGPFSSMKVANRLLREVRRIIPFCQQKKVGKTPCFYSKIGLCNPCPNTIVFTPEPQKTLMRNQYMKNIRSIIRILKGNIEMILKDLQGEVNSYAKKQEYEKALVIRNRMFRLRNLLHNRIINDIETVTEFNGSEKALATLYASLKQYFPNLVKPHRIECYDISSLLQKTATASMVVLIDGLMNKSEYKRFKIKNKKLHSDFSMLNEVLTRRFHQKWEHPDLLVVDGGKPQVKQILRTLSDLKLSIPVIGIAKNPDRIVISNESFKTLRFIHQNRGFNLIRELRDESHRFARKYHLLLRNKQFLAA